jgi:hypothetical protein
VVWVINDINLIFNHTKRLLVGFKLNKLNRSNS